MCVPSVCMYVPMCMCVAMCMCVCSYVYVPMYMCVSSYVCMCSQHVAIRSISYPKLALNSWESSCLYLLCAAVIPGILPHTSFNLLCIMKKIVHLVCVNKNVWKDAVWLWTTTTTTLLEGVCAVSEEPVRLGRISILCRGLNLIGPEANYFTLC